jgi:hypothetical protein
MGWGDEDVKPSGQDVKINYGRIFSFKTMSYAVNKIKDETKEFDDKHPKDELMSMWMNCMIVFLVLFAFTYSVLIMATGIFFFFYFYVLVQMGSAWKQFNYSTVKYWLMTVAGILVTGAIGTILKGFIFG